MFSSLFKKSTTAVNTGSTTTPNKKETEKILKVKKSSKQVLTRTPMDATTPLADSSRPADAVAIKVGIVGDAQSGKTSLVRRFQDDRYSEEYVQTKGVNYLEKRIRLGSSANTDVVFSLFDLGSHEDTKRDFFNFVCDDAAAVVFAFDLTRKTSLESMKESYRKLRRINPTCMVLLVGCKFDLFLDLDLKDQEEITALARRYARAMKAPLMFTSSSHSINVQKVFKILFGAVFAIDCKVERSSNFGEPIIEY